MIEKDKVHTSGYLLVSYLNASALSAMDAHTNASQDIAQVRDDDAFFEWLIPLQRHGIQPRMHEGITDLCRL